MRDYDDRLDWVLIGSIFLCGWVFLFYLFSPAKADDQILAESTVQHGGLICNDATEVVQFITLTEAGTHPNEAIQAIDGCGVLMKPMRMRVVSLGEYGTDAFRYLIVRYDFLDVESPPQFGIASRLKKDASL